MLLPMVNLKPITRLYPLEVMSEAKKSSTIHDQDDCTQVTVDNPVFQPVQAAA